MSDAREPGADDEHGVHSAAPEEPEAPEEDVEAAGEWADKTGTGGDATN